MAKVTKTSSVGINLIKSFEGFKSSPYLCPADVPTIGYGTTFYPSGVKVKLSDPPISEALATEYLQYNLKTFEEYVDSYTTDSITQAQFDALVSFAYNLGPTNLKNSTLLKKVNKDPKDPTIAAEFRKWVYAGGRRLAGLVKRREAEAKLYFNE
jgi:lysozyme